MALTTTRIYRWDDPGAPALTGTVGSLKNLLKTCLGGTGPAYGTKQKAGWSVAFEDTNKIALRNSLAHGGSGGYLRCVDDGSLTGGPRLALVQGFEQMTDIDTGINPAGWGWPWKARESGGSFGADAVPRCWVIVADERTVYMGTYVGDDNASPRGPVVPPENATGGPSGYFSDYFVAGDYEPRIAGDFPFMCAGQQASENPATGISTSISNNVLYGVSPSTGSAVSTVILQCTRNSLLSPVATKIGYFPSPGYNTPGQAGPDGTTVDDIMFCPAYVVGEGKIRGRLRGVYLPQSNIATAGISHLGTMFYPPGHELVTMAGSNSRWFVETTKSWDEV